MTAFLLLSVRHPVYSQLTWSLIFCIARENGDSVYIFPDFSAISWKKRKNVRIALGWVAGWRVDMNERYKSAQVNRCAAFHVSEREMSLVPLVLFSH